MPRTMHKAPMSEKNMRASKVRIAMTIGSLVAVGSLGTISAVASPGARFSTPVTASVHTATSDILTGVAFASLQDGWIIGNHLILHTSNGGKGFSQQYHGAADLQHIVALDTNHAFAWGYHHLLVTTDSGAKWQEIRIPGVTARTQTQIMDAGFTSETVGTVLTGQMNQASGLYLTTDDGTHWTKLSLPQNTVAAAMTSKTTGWLITSSSNKVNGGFYRTTDGGHHWVRTQGESKETWYINGANIVPTGGNSAYAQILGQAGMTQSSYSVYRTNNGTSWVPVLGTSTAGGGPAPGVGTHQHVAVGPGIDVGPMSVVGKGQLRVLGGTAATGIGIAQMAISNDGGQHWQTYPTIPGANGYPGADSMMSFVNGNDGWLLEMQGTNQMLLRTTNAGKSWREEYPRSVMWPVMGVSFITNKLAYGLGIVGDVNKVVKSTNGGKTWSPVRDLPVSHDLPYIGPMGIAIDFVNRNVGVAIGGNGNLYVTKNAAKSWHTVQTPSDAGRIFGVYATDAANRMTIETPNRIYVTTNSGRTWVATKSPASDTVGGGFADAINQVEGNSMKNGLAGLHLNAGPSLGGKNGPVEWIAGNTNNGWEYLVSANGDGNFSRFRLPINMLLTPNDIGFTSKADGFMWTMGGRLFTTHDGGKSWVQVTG